MKTIKARLAYSKNITVPFTPRGRQVAGDNTYINGFARIKGKTVTGFLFNAMTEKVFHADSEKHGTWVRQLALNNRKEAA
jgi:hypothetical protein